MRCWTTEKDVLAVATAVASEATLSAVIASNSLFSSSSSSGEGPSEGGLEETGWISAGAEVWMCSGLLLGSSVEDDVAISTDSEMTGGGVACFNSEFCSVGIILSVDLGRNEENLRS